ncbi:unnamed protein product [Owenia fusiformis]|uniref:Double-stranded RNA-specific adenosine deaminase n=1 Tax=Owenia fusiformis TaxID=6347 RepID=A0A8S4NUJ3_OWEFU|nr:unnamed protein product [Owenia fusiformis]
MDLKNRILQCFQSRPGAIIRTQDVCNNVGGQKKDINRQLYTLQRERVIQKVEEVPPQWKLISNTKSHQNETARGPRSSMSSVPIFPHQNKSSASNTRPTPLMLGQAAKSSQGTPYNMRDGYSSNSQMENSGQAVSNRQSQYQHSSQTQNFGQPQSSTPYSSNSQMGNSGQAVSNRQSQYQHSRQTQNFGQPQSSTPYSSNSQMGNSGQAVSNQQSQYQHSRQTQNFGQPQSSTLNQNCEQSQNRSTKGLKSGLSDVTAKKILNVLKESKFPMKAPDIAKAIGCQTASEVNPVIFAIHRKNPGLLKKVPGMPPIWQLQASKLGDYKTIEEASPVGVPQCSTMPPNPPAPPMQSNMARQLGQNQISKPSSSYETPAYSKGRGRGLMMMSTSSQQNISMPQPPWAQIGKPQTSNTSSSVPSPPIKRHMPLSPQGPNPKKMCLSEGRTTTSSWNPTQTSILPKATKPVVDIYGDLASKIVAILRASRFPMKAVDIAKELKMASPSEVNPTLFAMNKEKILKKVPLMPPIWSINTLNKDAIAKFEKLSNKTPQQTNNEDKASSNEQSTEGEEPNVVQPEIITNPLLVKTEIDEVATDPMIEDNKECDNEVSQETAAIGQYDDEGCQEPEDHVGEVIMKTSESDSEEINKPSTQTIDNDVPQQDNDVSTQNNGDGITMKYEQFTDTSRETCGNVVDTTEDDEEYYGEVIEKTESSTDDVENSSNVNEGDDNDDMAEEEYYGEVTMTTSEDSHVDDDPQTTVASANVKVNEQEYKILNALNKCNGQTCTATDLAKSLGFKSKKAINPMLYACQKKGVISKIVESPPTWALTESGSFTFKNHSSEGNFPATEMTQGASSSGAGFRPPASPMDMMNLNQKFQSVLTGGATNSITTTMGSTSFNSGIPNLMEMNPRKVTTPFDPNLAAQHSLQSSLGFSDDNTSISVQPSTSSNAQALNGEAFAVLNKNPISAFMEFAQSRKMTGKIDIVGQHGPPHNPKFTIVASFAGNRRFPSVVSRNKKDGKREAADVALRTLMAEGSFQVSDVQKPSPLQQALNPNAKVTVFDKIAALAHQAFNVIAATIPEGMAGRKVLAALIMKLNSDDAGTVICLGTGNRCITGQQLSLQGDTVNDSHAEIITRRSFMRFLHKELQKFPNNPDECILERAPSDGKFKVKDGISFHLYISTAPCGDGALFSPRDANSRADSEEELEHNPTFTSNVQGVLRTKMEGGEGTIPIEADFTTQTWDGILRGERLRTMSCSDKICRWNLLGLQGALLSNFLEPIYLSSLTLGYLYDHGHLARACCCRLTHGEPDIQEYLPPGFKVNHPLLGRVTVYDASRETEKTKSLSINWCLGDPKAEVTDGTKGQCLEREGQGRVSQVSKRALSDRFQETCNALGRQDLLACDSYCETKKLAADFQKAKKILYEKCKLNKYGTWVKKPVEEEMFNIK